MKPRFFKTPADLRKWLEHNHDSEDELWVGFYKKDSGRPSITWPELVDEVLCFGWIDGIRKGIDDERFMNRITPRRKGSNWSARNIKRAQELIELKLMEPAGLEAFEARRDDRSEIYSYEQRDRAVLDEAMEKRFRKSKRAWAFFESSPPSYRKTAVYWVMSAKRPETRERRLGSLIEHSAKGERVPPLAPRIRQSSPPSG
jgi:uncharacterized protein YdeI (YjbR/CyaY-like superfamily)